MNTDKPYHTVTPVKLAYGLVRFAVRSPINDTDRRNAQGLPGILSSVDVTGVRPGYKNIFRACGQFLWAKRKKNSIESSSVQGRENVAVSLRLAVVTGLNCASQECKSVRNHGNFFESGGNVTSLSGMNGAVIAS